ncbi:MAG: RnfABCDGE type electron transport complex subunit D [Bacteroidales bacterium]|nr:RnfABCDGE type electron transport complex subunit D [Bacteroidales bacterium]MBD5235411.1 RnfABCDGE type electron transport complex subunit D [Barnesiella sp.]
MESNGIIVTGSPHIVTRRSTRTVMLNVIIALLPAFACGVWFFGWRSLAVAAVSIIACMATEYICGRYMLGRRGSLRDCTALLTGLLLAMTLPSSLPLPMVFVGGVFAIGVGKMAFGGTGQNIFNPALVGRVFLLISFPVEMTTWPLPLSPDGLTGATVLSAMRESGLDASSIDLVQMAIGNMGGSLGEVGAIALLLGGIYLVIKKIIRLIIPISILATVAVAALLTGNDIAIELLSGGLLLGAIFMATDYVTSPMTSKGMLVYGILIGLITFVIRHYGSYPEGISFAILIMNGCTPLINKLMRPHLFGERRKK